jgi:tetratricopeptide (TPR) repeat protein
MSDSPTTSRRARTRRRGSWTVIALLALGGAVFVLFAVVGAVWLTGRSGDSEGWGAAEYGGFGLFLLVGLTGGGLFFGMSALLRALRGLHASLVRAEHLLSDIQSQAAPSQDIAAPFAPVPTPLPDAESADSHAGQDGQWQTVLSSLEDIQDSLLLSPRERKEKRERTANEDIQNAQVLVGSLTEGGDFGQAREVALTLQRRYPSDTRASDLVERVEHAREQHEAEDVNSFTRQVNDLISISAWERARQLTQQLLESHPDSAEARQLWLKVERQHRAFSDEQRRRMNAEIQRFVTRRRWEEALAAARIFVQRFPNCEDSEALRMQIPTLEANADIEVRQRLEAEIVDRAREGRYIEAAELARKIIEQYPDSPQAQVLRSQLGRLEELAQDPGAQPARVRRNGE